MPNYKIKVTRTVTTHFDIVADNDIEALNEARKVADFANNSTFKDAGIEDEISIVETKE